MVCLGWVKTAILDKPVEKIELQRLIMNRVPPSSSVMLFATPESYPNYGGFPNSTLTNAIEPHILMKVLWSPKGHSSQVVLSVMAFDELATCALVGQKSHGGCIGFLKTLF